MRVPSTLLLVCLIVGGCETLPPMPEADGGLVLSGRIKINDADQVSTFNFRWRQAEGGFDAYFWGVMGAGTTRLYGDSHTLSIEGRDVQASGPAKEILEEQLGWSLPVELLLSWVRGAPDASAGASDVRRDGDGAVVAFEQQGWKLRYEDFDELGRYARLTAEHEDVMVLVVVRERMKERRPAGLQ